VDLLQGKPHRPQDARRPANGEPDLYARSHELPIATQSVDLVVLPHVLEFAEEPHAILREVDRVMMPEGAS
jgi:ubiquinone/menaquinone biosynthesis C-methylase UbiE